jgi:hypothetical protein
VVEVGYGVLVECGVGVNQTVGVQVAGRRTDVGVGVGISMVGTSVAGGNGFREEVGSLKMENTTIMTTTVPMRTRMERISQILMFSFMHWPPPNRFCAENSSFCEYIRL